MEDLRKQLVQLKLRVYLYKDRSVFALRDSSKPLGNISSEALEQAACHVNFSFEAWPLLKRHSTAWDSFGYL